MDASNTSIRTRWAAIGAAVAVTLGAAGIGSYNLVNADVSSGDRPVYIPINPCRLIDTRPGNINVGPIATPISPDQTTTITAHGNNGECTGGSTIPSDATALAMNVTALNATQPTFLTFWGTGANPGTANLNPTPGQPPTPNAVNTPLSDTGTFNLFNQFGNVDVVIDVNGYYAPHDHDDRYEPIPEQIVVSPADFLPFDETVDYRVAQVLTSNTGDCFTAPIDLPDGATIELLTGVASVDTANNSFTWSFGRTLFADGITTASAQPGYISTATSDPIPTANELLHLSSTVTGDLSDNGDDAVVDNSAFLYYAQVCIVGGGTLAGFIVDLA